MAVLTGIIAAAGLALGAYGAYQQYQGSQDAAAANQQAIALQQQQEAERKKAMELDATRRMREVVRQNVAARSMSLAATTNQGADEGSGLPGAYGGESGRSGVNATGISQNRQIGEEMFGISSQLTTVQGQYASAMARSQQGAAFSNFGGSIVNNLGSITRLGNLASSAGSYGFGMMSNNFMGGGSGSFNNGGSY